MPALRAIGTPLHVLLAALLLAAQPYASAPDLAEAGSCPRRPCAGGAESSAGEGSEGDDSEVLRVQLLQQELLSSKGVAAGFATASAVATATTTTTLPPTGMKMNAAGDLKAFISSLFINIFSIIFGVCFFAWARQRYPIMYNNNVTEGWAPLRPGTDTWAWIRPTCQVSVDEVASCVTLDHAMMLEFTHLCMKLMAIIGVPMLCIMGPVNYIFGGHAAGDDRLSYLSYGNIQKGSDIFWIHCFVVWYVVLAVTTMAHRSMRRFLDRRFQWLRDMPERRANTVVVESIPDEFQSEEKLGDFIGRVLPGSGIKAVYVAKDVGQLQSLIKQRDYAQSKLKEAEAMLKKDPDTVPMVRDGYVGGQVEAVPFWRKQIDDLEPQVKDERNRIREESRQPGGVNTSSALVTFEDRSAAEILLRLDCAISDNEEEWEMFPAPQPADILWADLTQDDSAQEIRTLVGYLLVAGLYLVYLPIVIAITNLAKMVDFSKFGLGFIQSFWAGFAPTIGLQVMVAMLPTFLINIFKAFFTCRSEAQQQHKLQIWYFWFQVVFVLLATAVGQNARKFATTLLSKPTSIFQVLAETMPYATHFYMNFLALQWMAHSMVFTRYFPLFKFKAALSIYEEADAKAFAEPEDQDYYGIGSRSARWSITMAVCIVFGTLCPPINLLGFFVFLFIRVVYGYLFCFAESKKADLGGRFWVTQLQHLFVAVILYCVLMIGVLIMRASTYGPGIIAFPSLVWTVGSLVKLNAYSWEKLPIQELVLSEHPHSKKESISEYVQPEMLDS